MLSLIKNFSVSGVLIWVAVSAIVIFLVLPLHEFAHGYVAYLFGDKTAKNCGRLTLNPKAHLDLLGTLLLLLFGFGWAHPVPVDSRNFKHRKLGMAVTAFAGPLSNFIMAFLGAIGVQVLWLFFKSADQNLLETLQLFLIYYMWINVAIGTFNLLPIPPLDGFRILEAFLPSRAMFKFYRYQREISIASIILVYALSRVGLYGVVIEFVTNKVLFVAYKLLSIFV